MASLSSVVRNSICREVFHRSDIQWHIGLHHQEVLSSAACCVLSPNQRLNGHLLASIDLDQSELIGALGAALRPIRSLRQIFLANHRLQDFPWGNPYPPNNHQTTNQATERALIFIQVEFYTSWFLLLLVFYSSWFCIRLFYIQLFSNLFLFESVLPQRKSCDPWLVEKCWRRDRIGWSATQRAPIGRDISGDASKSALIGTIWLLNIARW